MDFDFSQEQRLLANTTRDLFKRECPLERVRKLMVTETACDEQLWSALAEQGWTGMTLPEEVDGLGLNFVDLCVVMEEMGRASLPGPFFSTFWAASLLQRVGTPAQQKPLLAAIASGEKKATVAWLDAGSTWCPESITMVALREGEHIRLTGKKRFVTDAAAADFILAVVRLGNEWAVAPIDRSAKGVSVHTIPAMDDTRKLAEVSFDGATIKASDLLAAKSPADLERANDIAAVALCAELVGAMQWLMDASLDYAKSRHQFDRPIGAFQGVQHQCADMLLYTESSRSAAYYAAWALGVDDPSATRAAAVAKTYCSEAGRLVGNFACQVHGGIGFTWEHDLHLFYKRAKFSEVLLGDPTYHRERVAKMLLQDSRTGRIA